MGACVIATWRGKDLSVMYQKLSVKSATVMEMETVLGGNVFAGKDGQEHFAIPVSLQPLKFYLLSIQAI